MTAKHTPGPWILGAETGQDSTRIETDGGKIIGAIRTREITRWEKSNPGYEWSDEGHANARLIAVTPKLLDIAIRLVEEGLSTSLVTEARAVINEATGVQS